MNTSAILEKVAEQGLDKSSAQEIIVLACAYWHEGFLPEINSVSRLSENEKLIIGYLTEFFSTFYVVKKERAIKLVEFANELKNQLKPKYNEANSDEIAAEWGLHENLDAFNKDILFYQTRHYVHNK